MPEFEDGCAVPSGMEIVIPGGEWLAGEEVVELEPVGVLEVVDCDERVPHWEEIDEGVGSHHGRY